MKNILEWMKNNKIDSIERQGAWYGITSGNARINVLWFDGREKPELDKVELMDGYGKAIAEIDINAVGEILNMFK